MSDQVSSVDREQLEERLRDFDGEADIGQAELMRTPIYYRQLLQAALRESYELEDYQYYGLRCNQDPCFVEPDMAIPDMGDRVEVHKIGETITWSCDLPAEIDDKTSLTSGKRDVKRENKFKVRHNLVAETFSAEETDIRLSEVFPILEDGDDILTPDLIWTDDTGVIHVIEVATSRAVSTDALYRVLEEKRFKYQVALQNRSTRRVTTYTPIVVGSRGVVSNIFLPVEIVNELMIRMKLSIALENVAYGNGILLYKTENEELLSDIAQEIKFSLSKITNKEQHHPEKVFITNDFIQSVLEEPDKTEVHKAYVTSRVEATKLLKLRRNDRKELAAFENKFKNDLTMRKDPKPVVNFPAVIPPRTKDSMIPKHRPMNCGGECAPLKELWDYCLRDPERNPSAWREENKAALRKEAMEPNQHKIEEMETKRKEKQKEYHRVSISKLRSPGLMRYLAKDGVFGKKFEKDREHKAREKAQKKPFHWDTNLEDIDDFLSSDELFKDNEDGTPEHYQDVIELASLANKMAQNSDRNMNDLEDWTSTNLFQMMDFYSDVAMELAISNKQHTKSHELILKKLRFWDCYLLIKPTNSKSHMFVSLFFPDKENTRVFKGWPFRPLIETTYHLITEFVSFRVDKDENIASMSASVLSFAAFYSDFYSLNDNSPSSFLGNPEARKMLLLTLITRLEDKAETEESMTLSRYMYMEIFKGDWSVTEPDPFKMLKKFNTIPRSRLNLWVIKRICRSFKAMKLKIPHRVSDEKPTKLEEGEDALPGDEWVGLLNCYTLAPIRTATAAVNLMYIGYVKNKNEVAQGNVEFKLVEKIVEEEMTLDLEKLDHSKGEAPASEIPHAKQFNKNCVMYGCSVMESRLKNTLGPDWRVVLEKDILENFARQLTHEIATLKASSTCEHTKDIETVSKKDNPDIHRVKVIEALACKLDMVGLNPLVNIESILTTVEDSAGGVIADLFKKNQHGGLREIYVLPIESRILQLFVEVISRTICSYFEEETLTHPANKLKLLDRHKVRTARMARAKDCAYADYCNSSDKTRWNQNFVMPALSLPLFRLTTPLFHNAIQRVLNQWANKLIRLPKAVCALLLSKVQLSSAAYTDLLHKFWDPKKRRVTRSYILKQCSSFINLTSGMMQGILHYTSSLLHLTYLYASKSLSLMFLRRMFPKWVFVMTQVCSSDDSATILSLLSEGDNKGITKSDIAIMVHSEITLLTLTKFCQFFCMTESVKSTHALFDYIEFNSEFLFRNTLAKPLIKLSAACTGITESESFMNRFHTMYNLITDLVSSGMPTLQVSFTQIAQLWIHYKTVGMSTNGLFKDWVKLALEFPDPVHGFFILDNELLCGIMGFSFGYWLATDYSENLIKDVQQLHNEEMELSKDGHVVKSLVVKHGNLKKWHQLMDRIDEGTLKPKKPSMVKDKKTQQVTTDKDAIKNRRDRINSNHEILFRHPRNNNELRLKLLMKASLPGVSGSLGKGNPFIQSLAMSMFAINTNCFTKVSLTSAIVGGTCKTTKNVTKTSLLREMTTVLARVKTQDLDHPSYVRNIKLKFPLLDRYKEAIKVIQSYADGSFIPVHRIRQRKNFFSIQARVVPLPLTLLQVVGKLWFGFNARTSDRIWKRCLESYKLDYPWLTESFSESLRQSPFQTPMELHQFVSTVGLRPRKLILCGPGVFSKVFSGQLHQIIRKYTKRGFVFETKGVLRDRYSSLDKGVSKLSLALMIPIERVRTLMVRQILRQDIPAVTDHRELVNLQKRDLGVLLSAAASEKTMSNFEIFQTLRELQAGIFVTFPRPQDMVKTGDGTKWIGKGEALVYLDGEPMRVELYDDEVRKITVKSFIKLRPNPNLLSDLLSHLGSRVPRKTLGCPDAIAKFTGCRFVPTSSKGIPVYEDRSLETLFFEPANAKFMVREGRCGIYSKVRGQIKPVIEFKAGIRDISVNSSLQSAPGIWESWIEMCPLDWKSSLMTMISADESLKVRYTTKENPQKMKEWIKTTLTSRLKFRGLGHSQYTFTHSIAPTEDEPLPDDDFDLDAIMGGILDTEMLQLVDDSVETQAEKLENELRRECLLKAREKGMDHEALRTIEDMVFDMNEMDVGVLGLYFHNLNSEVIPHSIGIQQKDVFTYNYMHPIWDEFIDEILKKDTKFFDKVLQGITSLSDPVFSKTLMRLLDITERSFERPFSSIVCSMSNPLMDLFLEDVSPSTSPGDTPSPRDPSSSTSIPYRAESEELSKEAQDENARWFNEGK